VTGLDAAADEMLLPGTVTGQDAVEAFCRICSKFTAERTGGTLWSANRPETRPDPSALASGPLRRSTGRHPGAVSKRFGPP